MAIIMGIVIVLIIICILILIKMMIKLIFLNKQIKINEIILFLNFIKKNIYIFYVLNIFIYTKFKRRKNKIK
jgi:hypothetical protein